MNNQYKSHDEALKAFNTQQDSFKGRFSETIYTGVRKAFDILTKQECLPCDACEVVLHDQIKSRGVRIAPEEQRLVIAIFEKILPALRKACTYADTVIYPVKSPRLTDEDLCKLASIYAIALVENLHFINPWYHSLFIEALEGSCLKCVMNWRIEEFKEPTCIQLPELEGGLFWNFLKASMYERIKHDNTLSILLNPLDVEQLLPVLSSR
ncbi:TPA: hypothetical protein ACGIJ0_002829 [Acinetobacter baumannii]|uniref:hypothetical protein n=1 Tax=Acinetobacter baumannii TaxID=470 RepID=UPI001CA974C5|nr:hypothetical protein [Acinetobacter baumannii]MCG6625289.1 hypothetical protein [Acinetobacter baumannii]MDC5290585.1 hypothetical protein [Acinetobacter baumannii]UAB19127.1 hypothetical protein H2785_13560 [Acinetobacter baumannii]UAB22570.1 hypothetical protein H2784_13525 [Acinetobacter baumannii]